jgi:glycosyltransferase involved in cell wall biosynthesis
MEDWHPDRQQAHPAAIGRSLRPDVRILIVGPSNRFQSGISTYTIRLANALHDAGHEVSVIAFRKLLPRFLFPGKARVGDALSTLTFHPGIPVFDAMDYNNPLTWRQASRFLVEQRPEQVVLQWWTSSAAHMHHRLRKAARKAGARVIVEMHEALDPLEQASLLIRTYASVVGRRLVKGNDVYITHSEADRALVADHYGIDKSAIAVVPHGSYDHYGGHVPTADARAALNIAEAHVVLFFGLIRPYNGVRVLVDAFERLPPALRDQTRLLVVGEVWEEGRIVIERIDASPQRNQITLIPQYVPDADVGRYFSAASLVALPYRRASQSGVAQIAVNYAKPLIVTRVGGLPEALAGFPQVLFIDPDDPEALATEMERVLTGKAIRGEPRASQDWAEVAHLFVERLETQGRSAD